VLDPVVEKRELDVELNLLDLNTDQYTLSRHFVVNRESIVIIEGVFLFKKELLKYLDLKVFLDISFPESVRRAIARNDHVRAWDIENQYAEKYHAGQRLYFRLHDPKSSADITINNEDYLHPFEVS
jgi:uridine kinase